MTTSSGQASLGWWAYPMKPIRVTEDIIKTVDRSQWTMERKYDGHRAILIMTGTIPCLWTRERRRIEMPKNLEDGLRSLDLQDGTVLDGEIWNPRKRGGWSHSKDVNCSITFWDVVRDGRRDLGRESLDLRREVLARLVGPSGCVRAVEALEVTKKVLNEVRQEAVKMRGDLRSGFVHGVVLKRRASPRRDHATKSHEHPDWMKIVFDGMSGWSPR